MASVEITISGMLYDKLARTTQNVVLVGEAHLTGLSVGGGPIIPPGVPGGGVPPGGLPHPEHPIFYPPGTLPHPEHPIVLPPSQVPPGLQPPTPPAPGSPTTPVPPPAGSPGWPVQPIAIPDYMIMWYPGVGPVVVAPPAQPTQPAKK